MRITIHRGTNQIGGCVTEYAHDGWRLFVDYGEQLPGAPKATENLKIEGLTHGDVSKSALLITHYHGDHIGKIDELPADLPIFMGSVAREIALTYTSRLGYVFDDKKVMAERIKTINTFKPGEKFTFGTFSITPIVLDHSAFDAYAFKIEADGIRVFHTGDFRTHGFRSRNLPKLMKEYIGSVDYVVCEATNVGRPDSTSITEMQLSDEFVQEFSSHKNNIVYVSSTNIDRLFALYHAACKTGRIFLVDPYQKLIMDIVIQRDPLWGKSRRYRYEHGMLPCIVSYHDGQFKIPAGMMQRVESAGYVLAARAGETFDNIISNLPSEDKAVYLSMWSGYLDKTKEAYSPTLAASVGDNYKYLHTSGHCDMGSLAEVFGLLHPRAIIPIHTDDPQAFAKLFCDRWPVILLEDGESINPGDPRAVDGTSAEIFYKGDGCHDKCWTLDTRSIGYFGSTSDAQFALSRVVYAPDRVIGYVANEEEDMEAYHVVVMDKHHNKIAEYQYGGHAPGGMRYQEASLFKPGDKVLAAIFECKDLIVEGEVIGSVDEELMWEYIKQDCIFDTFDEYRDSLTDWNWDCVAIKPICDYSNTDVNIEPLELPQRIYLFPMED